MDDFSIINTLPITCHYVPNFISVTEERQIVDQIQQTPQSRWTILTRRRLLALPSTLTGSARDTLLAAPMPSYLDSIVTRLKDGSYFDGSPHASPNHVLINEYKPGQGIMPHEDGPAYHPVTATISLGSHAVLEIYEKNGHGEREVRPSWRILQEPRSLLVTKGDMYVNTLHGISEITTDEELGSGSIANWEALGDTSAYESGRAARQTRVSLTMRDVIKVSSPQDGVSTSETASPENSSVNVTPC
jgi:alkylated DNA repair protein alkB homolog 6